jgi:poly(A) polymerase
MAALEAAGGPDCARFVGGCVRNALIGAPVADIDIATTLEPEETDRAIRAAGLKAVPTGIAHGTVTAVSAHQPFEITTLRRDVTTDGRNATVAFTDDWAEDAARRDFRLNALYADGEGRVFDPTGEGVSDAVAGRIVFVGDPETRIREDYLRILRFFRFFAWYGRGEPDAAALAACGALAPGMTRLSAERVSKELMTLLAAPDPREAMAAMSAASKFCICVVDNAATWLVDSAEGVEELVDALAPLSTRAPRIAIEMDVGLHRSGVRHIGGHGQRPRGCAALVCHLLQRLQPATGQHHGITVPQQRQRSGLADAGTGSGHHGNS